MLSVEGMTCEAHSILLITVHGNVSHCQLREDIAVHMCPFCFTDETTARHTKLLAVQAVRGLWHSMGLEDHTSRVVIPYQCSPHSCADSGHQEEGEGAFCAKYDPSPVELEVTTEFTKEAGN